ncbi:single-stranded DNA-binding protein [Polyangium aurulentum]|uniref:single-stranded DNA-binding protein n=1 Tax=Polyangium aurulentum TaxID=2567896 RepID=UPI0010ADBB2E|nr:single-stranded DNA-binding protein [Polyangium aurulentum]UQA55252.1 single-stranded DNA-binding protein [Polyangium aurulentum]
MSDGMNRVVLLGNLGADPELRFAANGTTILSFRMATNESYMDRNRELRERTEWHSVVLFGSRAEGLSRILSKGSCVLVEGTLRTSKYEKDGQTRYRTEVHARELCLTGASMLAGRNAALAAPPRDADDDIPPDALPVPPEDAPPIQERPEERSERRPARRKTGGAPRSSGLADEMPF